MPIAQVNGCRINYELAGPANAPALVLSNSLGSNFGMWDAQMPAFAKTHRVLRYDTRGHGQSEVTPGPYTFEQLARDVLALADSLNIDKFHFCGLSMGGVTGTWIALHAPERLQKLVLCSTGAKIGTADAWNTRIEAVRKNGTRSIAAATMERWFTAPFREREPQTVERIQKTLANTNNEGYIACCEALRDADLRGQVASISSPTLVISATHDPAAPPTAGKFLAKEIKGARYVELDAAHLSNIEQHEKFTQEVSQFLQKP
jgi:3-oxoadipate enol-lactonase